MFSLFSNKLTEKLNTRRQLHVKNMDVENYSRDTYGLISNLRQDAAVSYSVVVIYQRVLIHSYIIPDHTCIGQISTYMYVGMSHSPQLLRQPVEITIAFKEVRHWGREVYKGVLSIQFYT